MADKPMRRKLVTLELSSQTTPAHPGDSVLDKARVVGTVTSAGWGHRTEKNLALAFVEPDVSATLTVLVVGNEIPAEIVEQPVYDPDGIRVKA